ncbi:hypothetical protein F5X99DRAFT_431098 [Biscogniauxia marginata]|nr:hypothetical protein F5X99DRAFT_431098 [Biscogniauxia marginata]
MTHLLQRLVRFIFSKDAGYLVRDDILERRLECCALVSSVTSFVNPRNRPLELLHKAVGALDVILDQTFSIEENTIIIDQGIDNRLAFRWCLQEPQTPRRIAWVQGREDFESIRRAYEAAMSLGISLVILDGPGHWMEDDRGAYSYLREAFIPVCIDVDEGFVERIVASVKGFHLPIDGIVTISDVRLPGVAAASEILGLPTEPSLAYSLAGDKGATRGLEMSHNDSSWFITIPSIDEMRPILASKRETIQYPVVVKPCVGWNSECVAKCHNEAEIANAVIRASDRHANSPKRSTGAIIEPYIDGPELDANMVLLDGEVLFFEAADDFPSSADQHGQHKGANFMETQVVIPSKLPENELDLLRNSVRESILRQGFRSGVFHCEARIQNSKAQYVVHENDLQDLEQKHLPTDVYHPTSVYLLEINARPPGYLESVATLLAYGVDYYALRLLFALGTKEYSRIQRLAQPFRSGPQFHLSMTIIPATIGGIMKTEDATLDLLLRYPQLRDVIVDYKSSKKRGDFVQGPESSELWWVAYLSIISRTSRRDLLEKVLFVRSHFKYEVE